MNEFCSAGGGREISTQKGKRMMAIEQARWQKHRAACERWKKANYAYYIAQKRECAHRPAYLAHRREKYAARQLQLRSDAQDFSGDTNKSLNDIETCDERTDRPPDSGRGAAAGA